MRLRDSVFGSEAEKALYKYLVSRWSRLFSLYPSLPFANIVDLSGSELTRNERNFLYKTSVDYTLCTKVGKPILSLEFDGIGGGFSRSGEYLITRPFPEDPNREWKLDLKLRASEMVKYPFFIVSSEEARSLSREEDLTIVDGIIGRVLAHKEFDRLVREFLRDRHDAIEQLPAYARYEYIQDSVVIPAEVEVELKWDPIARKNAEYACRAGCGHGGHLLTVPPLPHIDWPPQPGQLEKRLEAWEKVKSFGYKVTVHAPEEDVAETVWVRNITAPGVEAWVLAKNIAELLAFRRVLQIRGEL